MGLKTIAVVGPTASGKTRKAVTLAEAFSGEIISCDSRQVYRDMTLGTGKDLEEYGNIKYHLIDICQAGYKYNLHQFLRDYDIAEKDVHQRGKRVVACGGSGMYVENALAGIHLPEVPENTLLRAELKGKNLQELTQILSQFKSLHNTTDVDTCQRAIRAIEIEHYYQQHPEDNIVRQRDKSTPRDALILGIDIDRETRRNKISSRLRTRIEAGMIEEVKKLLDSGIPPEDLIYYGLEYKFLTQYVIGILSYDEMLRQLEIAIHQFAKRQMTWFRGMERRGFKIHWLPYNISDEKLISETASLLEI